MFFLKFALRLLSRIITLQQIKKQEKYSGYAATTVFTVLATLQ